MIVILMMPACAADIVVPDEVTIGMFEATVIVVINIVPCGAAPVFAFVVFILFVGIGIVVLVMTLNDGVMISVSCAIAMLGMNLTSIGSVAMANSIVSGGSVV